jgi:NADH dehydrogenase [ubiquinone] 1 alpha subcomplex assembly factor 7
VSPFQNILAQEIERVGPVTVARFMELALGHPEHGYYMTRDPFGRAGDFTTAPEISQTFGELIGAWCAAVWHDIEMPEPIHLVELGPGRGTLMADALRVARLDKKFESRFRLHLIETSPRLRARQETVLAAYDPTWHESPDSVPPGAAIVIANEFVDALPIRQFEMTEAGWCERLVGLRKGDLTFMRAEVEPGFDLPARAPLHAVVEVCLAGRALAADLSERVVTFGGAALIFDYGHVESGVGDTLQAVRHHSYVPVLRDPGQADLTAHVDFQALGEAAAGAGAAVHGPVTQREFLLELGIEHRRARLTEGKTAAIAASIDGAVERLIAPDKMGTLFKALAIGHPEVRVPPGFEHLIAERPLPS